MREAGRSYEYSNAGLSHTHAYLSLALAAAIAGQKLPRPSRALDFGCGNGSLTHWLSQQGFDAVGVDISESGISIARNTYPSIQFSTDTSKENLNRLGPFDLVLSVEVIAHCYHPFEEMEKLRDSMRPGGSLILSTPYHGYLKNLGLALSGKAENHFCNLWAGNSVHFFSVKTITDLLSHTGFRQIRIARAGRVPALAKSMVVSAVKPN